MQIHRNPMAKWASFFEHLYICQKYPFSLKARRQASRLPPAAFFPEKWPLLKEPQRPYDQNGGSIAPRSLIFDPIAKETVYQKTHILRGRRRRRRRKNFPSQPDPIPSRRDIISRSGPAPHSDLEIRDVGFPGTVHSLSTYQKEIWDVWGKVIIRGVIDLRKC